MVAASGDNGNGGVMDGVCGGGRGLFVVVEVVCCYGSQLASGSTFLFLSTNMTTWAVHSPRVYKHSPNKCILPPGLYVPM
jgi:hypothetical protein